MHARLGESVTPFNQALQMPDVAAILNLLTDTGRAMLDGIVTQQAAMIAYLNDFKLLMLLTLGDAAGVRDRQIAAATRRGKPAERPRDGLTLANSFLIFSVCCPSAGTAPYLRVFAGNDRRRRRRRDRPGRRADRDAPQVRMLAPAARCR